MKVLSLFDGMSCGQIALSRAGIKVDKYYASEIDKHAQNRKRSYWTNIKIAELPTINEITVEDILESIQSKEGNFICIS